MSSTSTTLTSQPTPRDEQGQAIGFANTRDSPHPHQLPHFPSPEETRANKLPLFEGLGITSFQELNSSIQTSAFAPPSHLVEHFDDDMYFDDGNFDDVLIEHQGDAFDEAIFDDESANIRDIPAENAQKRDASRRPTSSTSQIASLESELPPLAASSSILSNGQNALPHTKASMEPLQIPNSVKGELMPNNASTSTLGQQRGLTEGNLAAYHNALVLAATEAAANGRFIRQRSASQASEDLDSKTHLHESQPGLVSDDSHFTHDLDYNGYDEDHGFALDDELADDLMIAEANAEVLENDDEGFYGQEFGFFARAYGKGNSELVNGGYFGPRGVDSIKRSHSAKGKFQEPSLTPITERSEWSARNSVASLQIPGLPHSAHSVPSPGIAQLLDLESESFDEEMSMSALMKVRRGWGGSQTSLNSLGGSHTSSSPLAHLAGRDGGAASINVEKGHKMTSSVHSFSGSTGIAESEEEEDYDHESPTLTQNTPRKKLSDPLPTTPQSLSVLSPASAASDRGRVSHSRTSSGAESVSYVMDPEGSGRWLLERRRTGDDGELEIIGREYLAGARI